MSLQDLTPASFEELLNSRFRLDAGGGNTLDLELFHVARLEEHGGPRQQPFSVFFRSPQNVVLPQAIYRVEHDQLGAMELFLVPIGPDGQGMRYEAVFN